MPILKKNSQVDSFKKGSKVACEIINGYDPVRALQASLEKFENEFGHKPNFERTRFVGGCTTFQTGIEVIEGPEED